MRRVAAVAALLLVPPRHTAVTTVPRAAISAAVLRKATGVDVRHQLTSRLCIFLGFFSLFASLPSSLLLSFTPLLLFSCFFPSLSLSILPLPQLMSRERTGRLKKKRRWEVLQDKKKGIRVDGVRGDADDGLTHDGDLHHACP